MKHMRALVLSLLPLCALSAPGHGQDAKTAGSVNWSIAPGDKPVQKNVQKKKSTGQSATLTGADTDKATRLEEGRKKFFEQSSGFDHSTMWDKSNMNMGTGSSKPGLGFGF